MAKDVRNLVDFPQAGCGSAGLETRPSLAFHSASFIGGVSGR
jgi:hypothetical protein